MSVLYVKPKHFTIQELVPKDLFLQFYQQQYRLWQFLDARAVWTQDRLRDRFGKCYVNTWYKDGNRQYSGLRSMDCEVGAEFSQHKFGRAFDSINEDATSEEVRQDILTNNLEQYKYITCLEEDVDWVHFDVRAWNKQKHGILLISRGQ